MGKYAQFVPISSVTPFNVGLHSPTESTMRSLLGSPDAAGLDTSCDHNDNASDVVKKLLVLASVGPFRVQGIRPAVESLTRVFAAVPQANTDLFQEIANGGMLCVRFRKPTSGAISQALSNHSWGTAIDITVDGLYPTHRPDHEIPLAIATLIKPFNDEGWYSGVGFGAGAEDDMHFEVADETLHKWAQAGDLS